jgi:nitrogen fixation/metabolism regulation signal transduction histidine kinase
MPENNTEPTPGGHAQYRRRIWVVDKKTQGKYILQLFVAVAIGLFCVALTMTYLKTHYATEELFIVAVPRLTIGLMLGFALIVVPLVGLLASHRIAGPMYRVRESMKRIIAGDYHFRIHLRKHDYFKETANIFNDMLETLESRDTAETQRREQAVRDLEQVTALLTNSLDESGLPDALRLIEETVENLKK